MRAMAIAACRTLGPTGPGGVCRAAASASRGGRGAARVGGGRGNGGGGGVGGVQRRGAPPRETVTGDNRGAGQSSPAWGGGDQRAEGSNARRGVGRASPRRDGDGENFGSASSPGDAFSQNSLENANPNDAPQRVAKLMAWRGLCSRREAETLISRGVVTVDGEVAKQGDKALCDARITVDERFGQSWLRSKITLVLNKPVGVVSNLPSSTESEAAELLVPSNAADEESVRVFDEAREWKAPLPGWEAGENNDAPGDARTSKTRRSNTSTHKITLNVCGRLDKDSRGLLVLTQDGVLAKSLIGGNGVPKTYEVTVDRPVSDDALAKLNGDVFLDGSKLRPMRVRKTARANDGEHVLQFTLREGKNRQIRRVLFAVGLRVTDLVRTKIGGIALGDLPEGRWRAMSDFECASLRSARRD